MAAHIYSILFRFFIIFFVIFCIVVLSIEVAFIWTCQQPKTPTETCICDSKDTVSKDTPLTGIIQETSSQATASTERTQVTEATSDWGPHSLSVLVPFRDRWEELLQFIPHIHGFLNRQKVTHHIWVINQADEHRFNRAMLINVGFTLSRSHGDYFVMHDVDLLPLNDDLSYGYPDNGPLHIASPELHPLYHYKKFVGGIMMMTNEDFVKINGLTNIFWGWGREDDEFYLRMTEAKLELNRPQGIKTGYKTFQHLHDKEKRPRDMESIGSQKTISRRRDKETGLNNLKYEVTSSLNMTISGAKFTFVNVKLHCDYSKTPFCDHKKSS